jgi:galactose mutarotase-like enzyme
MKISNGILTATINLLGAEITSLSDYNREYIWHGDPKYWSKHSPILFPIVGALKNNSYIYEGKVYALNRHGFARDNIFSIEAHAESRAVFLLSTNNDTMVMYPFNFELEIAYVLIEKSLEVTYTVRNKGNKNMPFAIGGHPAFALQKKFGNYSLKFEKDEALVSRQLQDNLITPSGITIETENGILPLDYKLFENDALVFTGLQSRSVELLEDSKPLLRISFEKMPHMGIWTKINAPFICIEPWQGYADTVNATGNLVEKEGIIILQPEEEYSTGYSIQILR